MKRNSLLCLALHNLNHLAGNLDRIRKSIDITVHSGINTIAALRVLGKLSRAGLINSENGVR